MFSFQTGELIIQKYGCRLPWMDIHQFDTKIPWCNTNETFHLLDDGFYDWNALMKSSKVKEICGQSPKCHRTMYDLQIDPLPQLSHQTFKKLLEVQTCSIYHIRTRLESI